MGSYLIHRYRFSIALAACGILPGLIALAAHRSDPPVRETLSERLRVSLTDIALSHPREELVPVIRRVRTENIIVPRPEPMTQVTETVEEEPQRVIRPRRRVVHYVKRSGDICQRHNMRKVMVGKYRWRCKK
jgi:hypothetical protein